MRFALPMLLLLPVIARGDAFDLYFNNLLVKMPTAPGVQKIEKLSPDMMVEHSRVLSGITATFVVVKTNEDRMAKLLLMPARQKVTSSKSVPILLIDRFVTYQDGTERAIQAQGKNVRLFDGFHFNLDLGQVVPTTVPGDIKFVVADDGKTYVEPVGKAELYLVTQPHPDAAPKKTEKFVIGPVFEPQYFSGQYKLYDDGRRSGELTLKVTEDGDVAGSYVSDKDGQKYEVAGKVTDPVHKIHFRVTFPRTLQFFQGMMFTGDGRIIAGTSKLQEHETAFYAVRQD